MACLVALCPISAQAQSRPDFEKAFNNGAFKSGKKLDTSKIKAEIEKTRREIEQKRREMQKSREKPQQSSELSKDLHKNLPKSSGLKSSALSYRVKTGQKIAYLVEMSWLSNEGENRIVGKPLFHVRYRSGDKSTVLVVGRFQHFLKKRPDEPFQYLSGRDYWMGSVKNLEAQHFGEGGRKPVGELAWPYLMGEFVSVPQLMMPHLPYAENGKEGKRENAVLTHTQNGTSLWRGFTGSGNQGEAFRSVEAKPLSSSTVQLDIRSGFVMKSSGFSAVYSALGDFDKSRGLLESLHGTYTLVDNGQTQKVTIDVRRLFGEDLKTANEEAQQNMQKMPSAVVPVEIMRTPLSSKHRAAYSANELPRKGETVGYYDNDMNQHYQVIYLGRGAEKDVKIQFAGSGEIRYVAPGKLTKLNAK